MSAANALAALSDPPQPSAAAVSDEVSYISGVDGFGNGAITDWWQTQPVDPFARKWGSVIPGTPAGTVTYAFDPTEFWNPADQAMIVAGMALWSAVTNIQFVVTGNYDDAQVDLQYRDDASTATGTYESAIGPAGAGQPYVGTLQRALVQFDPAQLGIGDLNSFTAYGGYGVDTVIHELGHVLGLGHAGPYNGTIDPETQQLGPYDTRQWSLMSYINPWAPAAYSSSYPDPGTYWGLGADGYYREPTTWMPLDILAAQRLYGLPASTPLSGGQTFGFHCNIQGPIEQFFDFTINTSPVVTLWDEGGGNTLDVSGFSAPATIDLRPGAFSSVDGMVNDIGIAFGTAIDNVVAGVGNTTFVVNGDSDSIMGGGGADQALFAAIGNYTDRLAGGGRVVSARGGPTDTLQGVGALSFTAGDDTIASNVGGAISVTGGHNAVFLTGAVSQVTLGSADTLVATGGSTTVQPEGAAGTQGDYIFDQSGALVYYGGATQDTIAGSDVTVVGGAAGVVAYGRGVLQGQGGAGYAVMASFGASSETVQSGAGGGLLVGGADGNNRLTAAGGATIIFSGGANDLVTLANAALDTVVLAGGPETVNATAASGGSVIYAGTGNDLIEGGPATDYLAAGSGNDTLSGGGGINAFLFIAGRTGGSDVITDWAPGRDYLFLIGYGGGADAAASASQVQSGGNTLVTLADHTQIWFMNTHGVAASAFA